MAERNYKKIPEYVLDNLKEASNKTKKTIERLTKEEIPREKDLDKPIIRF